MNVTLGNYQIMIASKYFESIDDFINLEIAVKRFRGNMERFHFNPIFLNDVSRKMFPNIETLHLYDEDDAIFKDGKIFKHCIWYGVDYGTYLNEKEEGNECKSIFYSKEDREAYGNEIPKGVKLLGDFCYEKCIGLKSIIIPISVNEISPECFYLCCKLTSVILPTSITKIPDLCFSYCTSLKSISIPISVVKLGCYCFSYCKSLESIKIPSSVRKISDYSFYHCSSLQNIDLQISNCDFGQGCFYKCDLLKKNIELPIKCFELRNKEEQTNE